MCLHTGSTQGRISRPFLVTSVQKQKDVCKTEPIQSSLIGSTLGTDPELGVLVWQLSKFKRNAPDIPGLMVGIADQITPTAHTISTVLEMLPVSQ